MIQFPATTPKESEKTAMNFEELEKRIIRLESLVSMQDDLIETLNQVISQQQLDMHGFRREIRRLEDSIEQDPIDMDKRPPHY